MILIFTIVFVLVGGFFSGSETAYISINRIKLHAKLRAKKNHRAKTVNWLANRTEDMIGMFLVGTNICVVSATVLFTKYLAEALPNSSMIPLWVTLIMTPTVMLFTDVFPKVIFRQFADGIMDSLAYVYFTLFILLFPIQFLFVRSVKGLLRILGIKKKRGAYALKDDFKTILDISSSEGALRHKERDFIESIMEMKDITAREVIVPLNRLVCVEEKSTVSFATDLMLSSKHSRLPVFRARVDNIVGYVESRDFIDTKGSEGISSFLREALYVPECLPIDDVLLKMQQSGIRMAFTVDEYGGVSGVITPQDLISEIVGEFMEQGSSVTQHGETLSVKGLLDIDELEEELGLTIHKESYETVAGFVLNQLKHIPSEQESFEFGKWIFEIEKMTGNRIDWVKIYPKKRKSAPKDKTAIQGE